MSDNIDYQELDRIIGEVDRAKDQGKKKEEAPRRPRRRGQFMEFVPLPGSRPTVPMQRRVAPKPKKPRPRALAPRAVTSEWAKTRREEAFVYGWHHATEELELKLDTTGAKPEAKSAKEPKKQQTGTNSATSGPTQSKPEEIKTQARKEAKDSAKENTKKDEDQKTQKAQYTSIASLGVRSPFMTNTKVEKYPLGDNTAGLRPNRNIYSPSKQDDNTKFRRPNNHYVAQSENEGGGWLWAIAVLLVLAVGAGLGYLAYLLVFSRQLTP